MEFLFPYAWPKAELLARLQANGLQQVLLNAPAAGRDQASVLAAWETGERGLYCQPERQARRRGVVLPRFVRSAGPTRL